MAAARKGRGSLKNVKNAEGLPITFDDVMIPLGRAKAALWLLDALEGGNVSPPDEHASWVRDICLCTIRDSIDESEREYVKKAGTVPDKAVAS